MTDTENKKNNDMIRYDKLAQEALRGVVKKVMEEIADVGELPGNHHFYVTFNTNAQGVKLSKVMKEKYPEEMTIVIQHQYWDLKTSESGFAITLSFNDNAEKLKVPYNAITGFFDPSVEFGLQFEEMKDVKDTNVKDKDSASGHSVDDKIDTSADDTSAVDTSADVVSIEKFRKNKK